MFFPEVQENPRTSMLRDSIIYALLALGCVGSGLGLFQLYKVHSTKIVKTATVYLELKAISAGGHPQSGAQVFVQNQLVGLTNSFGEWHGFRKMPVACDSVIKIIKKNSDGINLQISKAIPIPDSALEGRDIQVIKTLQLDIARS